MENASRTDLFLQAKARGKFCQRIIPQGFTLVETCESPAYAIYHGASSKISAAPCALRFRGKQSKPSDFFRYRDVEERAIADRKFVESCAASEKFKADMALARQSANTLKIGDILVSSWGYDQTNVDAYQIVAKTGAQMVKMRRIGLEIVEATGWASDTVKPVKDAFINDEIITKKANDSNSVRIASYAHANLWDGQQDFHRSWYA